MRRSMLALVILPLVGACDIVAPGVTAVRVENLRPTAFDALAGPCGSARQSIGTLEPGQSVERPVVPGCYTVAARNGYSVIRLDVDVPAGEIQVVQFR